MNSQLREKADRKDRAGWVIMAALILGEPIGLLQLAGTAVVLSAVWTLSRRRP
jgi:hypothetical protein